MTAGEADNPTGREPGKSPRVLFKESAPPAAVKTQESISKPKVLFGNAQPPSEKSREPRVLALGEIRQRIPCSPEALREVDVTASARIVEQALRIVNGTNLDDHHFDDVVRFGAALQSEHGLLAEAELALVENEALAQVKRLGAELLQCMRALDPDKVFSVREGILQTIRMLTASDSPADAFARFYPRIQVLAQDLRSLAPQVEDVVQKFHGVEKRYRTLDHDLAAHILAGNFLVKYVGGLDLADGERQAHFASQANAIETRIASLAATRAMVEVSRQTLQVMAGNVGAVAGAGQGLLQEELPAWHAAYSAALVAARNSEADRTGSLAPLRTIHKRILEKLKSEG